MTAEQELRQQLETSHLTRDRNKRRKREIVAIVKNFAESFWTIFGEAEEKQTTIRELACVSGMAGWEQRTGHAGAVSLQLSFRGLHGCYFSRSWSLVFARSPGYGRIAMGVGLLREEEEGEERTVPGLEYASGNYRKGFTVLNMILFSSLLLFHFVMCS